MAAAFIDYYDIFHLERSMSEKEIKKKMAEWSIMLTQMDGSTDPSNIAEKKQLREKRSVFGKPGRSCSMRKNGSSTTWSWMRRFVRDRSTIRKPVR